MEGTVPAWREPKLTSADSGRGRGCRSYGRRADPVALRRDTASEAVEAPGIRADSAGIESLGAALLPAGIATQPLTIT